MASAGSQPFARLVDLIYDCVLAPERWPHALEAVCRETNLKLGVLGYYETAGRPLLRVPYGMAQEWFDRMPLHAEGMPGFWGGPERIRAFPPCEIVVHSIMQPTISPAGQRFKAEWLDPQDVVDMIGTNLSIDADGLATMVLGSGHRLAEGRETDLDLLRAVVPHLRRAVTIGRLFEFQAVRRAQLAAALDAMPQGTLLLDERLTVHHANRSAVARMGRASGLRIEGGRLVVEDADCARALSKALLAARNIATMGHTGIAVPIGMAEDRGAVLHVFPITTGSFGAVLDSPASAVVFIAEADARTHLPTEALMTLFDLTPAEARVCELIARGLSPGETAAEIGVAVSTVRTHLLRIYQKTGTGRQSELAALCQSVSIPGAPRR